MNAGDGLLGATRLITSCWMRKDGHGRQEAKELRRRIKEGRGVDSGSWQVQVKVNVGGLVEVSFGQRLVVAPPGTSVGSPGLWDGLDQSARMHGTAHTAQAWRGLERPEQA